MKKYLNILLIIICFSISVIIPNIVFSQCGGSVHDSGPSNYYKDIAPTNFIIKGPDFHKSLIENIRRNNLAINDFGYLFISILLMFFCIFTKINPFFKACIVLYGAPFILYNFGFRLLHGNIPFSVIIFCILSFFWGGCFKFSFKINKNTVYYSLLSILFISIGLLINKFYTNLLPFSLIGKLNDALFTGQETLFIQLLLYIFLGSILVSILHGLFINKILREFSSTSQNDELVSQLIVKVFFFCLWLVVVFFVKPIGVLLFTIFILGTVFSEKQIIQNSLTLVRNNRFLLVFLFILLGNFIFTRGILGKWIFLGINQFMVLIFLGCTGYFLMIFILQKIFKKKINGIYMTSIHPLFMLSHCLLPNNKIDTNMYSIFYFCSVVITLTILAAF